MESNLRVSGRHAAAVSTTPDQRATAEHLDAAAAGWEVWRNTLRRAKRQGVRGRYRLIHGSRMHAATGASGA